MNPIKVTVGESCTLPPNKYKHYGSQFIGWNIYWSYDDSVLYQDQDTITVSSDLTLYARWKMDMDEYPLTISPTSHGKVDITAIGWSTYTTDSLATVTPDGITVAAGASVYLSAVPETGYHPEMLVVNAANNLPVTVQDNVGYYPTPEEANTENIREYSFDMPMSAVTASITFVPNTPNDNIVAQGYCGAEGNGQNVSWSLTTDETMTISGIGEMEDYSRITTGYVNQPWEHYMGDIQTIIVEDGVTNIGNCAFVRFLDSTKISNIEIPLSVTVIGAEAFYGSENLINVKIPSKVITIRSEAFAGCEGLTSITIPVTTVSIQQSAFEFCTSLKDVYYSGTKAQWGEIEIDPYCYPYEDEESFAVAGNKPLLNAVIHCEDGVINGNDEPLSLTISTQNISEAVQYIPFAYQIESTVPNGNASDVKWSVTSGSLPDGVSLSENGVLSGVARTVGAYPFTVTASLGEATDNGQFTLNVSSISDANWETITANGHEILNHISDMNKYEEQTFRVAASLSDFAGLWLDGLALTAGTDFVTAEGSTAITIPAKTFETAGEGTHTIAAAFKEGNLFRVSAQNYTVNLSSGTYAVTVNNGSGSGEYAENASVTIAANTPESGKQFKEWTGVDGLTFTSGSATTANATFTMPAKAVTVTATYEDIIEAEYDVTVNKGTGSGKYKTGDSVSISANAAPEGKVFDKWLGAEGLTFTNGNQNSASATFTMPGNNIDLSATFRTQTNDQGCYVATAVYGSYDCPEVWTLRRFRDNVLAKTWYGRLFIRLYYAVSPTAVKLFGDCEWFQNFFRDKLDKMVSGLQADGFESTPYQDRAW